MFLDEPLLSAGNVHEPSVGILRLIPKIRAGSFVLAELDLARSKYDKSIAKKLRVRIRSSKRSSSVVAIVSRVLRAIFEVAAGGVSGASGR